MQSHQLTMQILQCKNVRLTQNLKYSWPFRSQPVGGALCSHIFCDRLKPALYLNDKSKSVRFKDNVRTRYESKEPVNVSREACSSYANSIRYIYPLYQRQDKENYCTCLIEIMIILLQFMHFSLR